jgi:hypothetical protein
MDINHQILKLREDSTAKWRKIEWSRNRHEDFFERDYTRLIARMDRGKIGQLEFTNDVIVQTAGINN